MKLSLSLSLLGLSGLVSSSPHPPLDPAAFSTSDVITRDVAIIGSGAAGTYAAVQLKDAGKSIIVIEQKSQIGGHTENYVDPATKIPINLGVQYWLNIDLVKNIFARFQIPLTFVPPPNVGAGSLFVDFTTGKSVTGLPPSDNVTAVAAAIQRYGEQLAKYPYLDKGYFLPDPVPGDLLPFGEFAKKYGIEAFLLTLFEYIGAFGDILESPTVNVFAIAGQSLLNSLATGFLTTSSGNNRDIYEAATKELLASNSLFLNSTVLEAIRPPKGPVTLLTRTQSGLKLIQAKKLLIAIPPTASNLQFLDLSRTETRIFSTFNYVGYYTGVLNNTGIPSNYSFTNLGQSTPYHLPPLPEILLLIPARVPGLFQGYYGTLLNGIESSDSAKQHILESVGCLQSANPTLFQQTKPNFVDFRNHAPFSLRVGVEQIKKGFYRELYGLQGKRNTYFAAAAWRAEDSSIIWQYVEDEVVPALKASLGK